MIKKDHFKRVTRWYGNETAVLVAISIPIFNGQLEKARENTDIANLRSAKAEAVSAILNDNAGSDAALTKLLTGTNNDASKVYYNPITGKLVESIVVCGKGTATTVSGVTYNTDEPYKSYGYTGGDMTSSGIAVNYDKTSDTVTVTFEAAP